MPVCHSEHQRSAVILCENDLTCPYLSRCLFLLQLMTTSLIARSWQLFKHMNVRHTRLVMKQPQREEPVGSYVNHNIGNAERIRRKYSGVWTISVRLTDVCECEKGIYTCCAASPLTMWGMRESSPFRRGGGAKSSGIWSVIIIVTYIHGEIDWTALPGKVQREREREREWISTYSFFRHTHNGMVKVRRKTENIFKGRKTFVLLYCWSWWTASLKT